MVSKILNEVISAEKQAAGKVDLANKKSDQIISDASEKAKDIIDKAKVTQKLKASCKKTKF